MSVTSEVLIEVEKYGGLPPRGYFRVCCPACPTRTGKVDHKASLSINCDNGFYRCFKCSVRGRLPGFDDGTIREEPEAPVERPKIERPEGFYPLTGDTSRILSPFRDYVRGRGFTDDDVRWAGMGACTRGRFAGRVIVPTPRTGDVWDGFVARSILDQPNVPKYLCPKGMPRDGFYNAEALTEDSGDPVLVVEGVFDALAHRPNAVACLGKIGETQLEILSRCERPVVFVLDYDAQLESVGMALRMRVMGRKSGVVVPAPGHDPATTGKDILVEAALDSLQFDIPEPIRL